MVSMPMILIRIRGFLPTLRPNLLLCMRLLMVSLILEEQVLLDKGCSNRYRNFVFIWCCHSMLASLLRLWARPSANARHHHGTYVGSPRSIGLINREILGASGGLVTLVLFEDLRAALLSWSSWVSELSALVDALALLLPRVHHGLVQFVTSIFNLLHMVVSTDSSSWWVLGSASLFNFLAYEGDIVD